MSDDERTDDGDRTIESDYWQVAFVALAIVGLAVAAFVAPPVSGHGGGSDGGDGGDLGGQPEGGDGGGLGLIELLLRILAYLFNPGGGEGSGEPACRLQLDSEPIPGDEVTVTVWHDGEPVTDAVVWFDDRRIGRTDDAGRVTGEVPYTRPFRISVDAPSLPDCEGTVGNPPQSRVGAADLAGSLVAAGDPLQSRTGDVAGSLVGAGDVAGSLVGAGDAAGSLVGVGRVAGSAVGAPAGSAVSGPDRGLPDASSATAAQEGNGSASFPIDAGVTIEVVGQPYPGETVAVVASIQGVPMREATVTVAGESVATTDDDGRAAVRMPDGADTVSVTVSRGDFSGTKSVEVLLLEPTLRPDGLVLVPAGEATVVASIADAPVADAAVGVGGEPAGTTGPDGELPVVLPLDPTTPVTVSTDRQTASVSLVGLYWPFLVVGVVLVGVLSGVAYRRRGRSGVAVVAGGVAIPLVVVAVDAYLGRTAGLATAATIAVVLLAAGLYRWRRAVPGSRESAAGAVSGVVERVVAGVLRVVGGIERLLDLLAGVGGRLAAWLRSLPRSVSGLVLRFVRGTRRLLVRAVGAVRRVPVTPTSAGVAAVAVAAVVGGYSVDGVRGVAVVAVALLLAGVAWWFVGREEDGQAGEVPGESAGSAGTTPPGSGTSGPVSRSVRGLWRAFARRVVPDRWRTRTAAEVGRTAVERGYPDGPVRELTTAFREVEYGDRPVTDAAEERARDAYRTLVDSPDGDTGSDPAGDDREPGVEGS